MFNEDLEFLNSSKIEFLCMKISQKITTCNGMNKMGYYISFLILFFNFSCKTHNKIDLKISKERDSQKTTELIIQILKEESNDFLKSSCIVEKPITPSHPIFSDFNENVKKELNIKDTIHFNMQILLYKQFKLTSDLVPEKNILTVNQLEKFERESENQGSIFWEWLELNCKNGFCSISKPIFNETFNLAYVQLGIVYGELSISGEERIYEFVNDKWIKKESIGSWAN